MTIGLRRVRLEFSSLSTTRVVNHSRFLRTTSSECCCLSAHVILLWASIHSSKTMVSVAIRAPEPLLSLDGFELYGSQHGFFRGAICHLADLAVPALEA